MNSGVAKLCSIDGCYKKNLARGWCQKHYQRWKRHGDPTLLIIRSTCSFEGCENKHHAKGFCETHYTRWWRHEDPNKVFRFEDPEDALTHRTKWVQGCRIWTGSTTHGYGLIHIAGKTTKTHRYVWERENGPIPKGMDIDHICHNRACCRIEHLRLATRSQNASNRAGPNRTNTIPNGRNISKRGKSWAVRMVKDGEEHYFGRYSSNEDATRVAEQKRKELFGEFAGKG